MKSDMYRYLSALFFTALLLVACNGKDNHSAEDVLKYNQVGYFTSGPKLVLLDDQYEEILIKDLDGKLVLRVFADSAKFWEPSGDTVRRADFSWLNSKGTFLLEIPGCDVRYQITVSDKPYDEVVRAAIKAFYYNRTAIPLEEKYAGNWYRQAGHPDTVVYVHASAATEQRPEGTVISSPLGWYDAGDYNKYVVNSAITTYTLLKALKDYREYFDTLGVNIPESGSGLPDLLSETLFNLRWVLTMQDPFDGGVYHKLTSKQFDDFIMPHESLSDRYVVAKSTAAALDFTALNAAASRILRDYEELLPGLADSCLAAAKLAWNWALQHPDVYYKQPEDIVTGAYGDWNLNDEWYWAASELFIASGDPNAKNLVVTYYDQPSVPNWMDVRTLGTMSLLENPELEGELSLPLSEDFIALADDLVSVWENSPYAVSIQSFAWGSNSTVANEGMLKMCAYRLSGNRKYLESAISDLDYILGRNATGYCFVTGFGEKRVMNIHHRPSEADGIHEPIPGFLAGGPNLDVLTDCSDDGNERSPFPAKSYVDMVCSYSTNEIAINWNAPLVYLVGAINASAMTK